MNQWEKFVSILENQKDIRKNIVLKLGYQDISKGCYKLLNQVRNKTIKIDRLELISEMINLDKAEVVADYIKTKKHESKERAYLEQIKYLKNEVKKRDDFKPYIYINTELIDRNTPIFIRNIIGQSNFIDIPQSVLDLSKADRISFLKEFFLEHYENNKGILKVFFRITGYTYQYSYNKSINFSISGKITNEINKKNDQIDPFHYKNKIFNLTLD